MSTESVNRQAANKSLPGRFLSGYVGRLLLQSKRPADPIVAEAARIAASGLFDALWFAEQHPEAAMHPAGALLWQLREAPLLAPHPLFDVAHYVASNPGWEGVAATPLGHYVLVGAGAGATPHVLFDPAWYASQVPGVPPSELFRHYLTNGFAEGLSPHSTFDPGFYATQVPDLFAERLNPLTHFVLLGAKRGLWPNRLFDTPWYVARNPDCAQRGLNPLVHFLTEGSVAGQAPHPCVDLASYIVRHADVPQDPVAAYCHLLVQRAGRISDVALDTAREAASPSAPDAPAVPARPVIDLEDYTAEASAADRLPHGRPTRAPAPLLAAIAAARRVSFDIWDTLLRRDCHPDEIKLQSARLLKLRGQAFLRDQASTPADLLAQRLEAEAAVARAEYEFRFPEAVDVWLFNAMVPSTPPAALTILRQALVEHEFAAERRATRPDCIAAEVLQAASGRASYASDFYMPDGFMDRLLATHGLDDGFIARHVSCDSFETKRGGQLFDRILAETALPARDILHIGDNLQADIEAPRSRGLRSIRYLSPVEEARKAWFGEAFEAQRRGDGSPHQRRILGLLEDLARGAPDETTATGIRLAPLAFGFCLNAAEGALAAGAEELWFFTREGTFLREVYEAIRAADPFNTAMPDSGLLEVSRLATFGPSLPELSVPALMRLWSLYSTQSIADLGASLNLDPGLMRQVAARHGLAAEQPIQYPWKSPAVLRLLEDANFRTAAGERLDEQRRLLRGYLAERGFTPGATPRHCVDIGWRGTIQDNVSLVSGAPTVGWYLGLFGFLNPQPPRSRKHGWLGDANVPETPFALSEVAGFEMLFNAPGGSVKEYTRQKGEIVARRAQIAGEEAVICGPIAAIQRGMLAAVAPVADYVRLHGLVSADLLPLARRMATSIAERPPVTVADAFAALEHDETFGSGRSEKVGGQALPARLDSLAQGALLDAARSATMGLRWPAAALRTTEAQDWLEAIGPDRRAALPTAFNLARGPALLRGPGDRFSVYAPAPIAASGGHRTLFNVARRFATLGWRLEVFLERVGEGVSVAEEYLAGTSAVIHTQWHRHIGCDMALATIAHSARFVAELPNARHRAYLVQDHEALFNPVSDAYLRCEASYTHGMRHITIGNWLTHLLRRQYAADALPAGLGCDTALYRPRPEVAREDAVCFLYQPDKPRRTPEHGIHALRLLKRTHPEVTIYVYGSNLPINLDFPVVNLGLILDLEQLAKLYARCKVGLCISASNPSRIPFEMMAAGCVPVDLYRYNNLLDYRSGTAVLAFSGEYSLFQAMLRLLEDPAGCASRSATCMADAAGRSLDWELEAAANHLLDLARGAPTDAHWSFPPPYAEPPVVAPEEDRPGVCAFLRFQAQQIDDVWPASATDRRSLIAAG